MPIDQRTFWDAVAPTKEFSHPFDRPRFGALVDPSARILDYGCGYGRIGRQLWTAGYTDIRGVDPSPRMVDRARAENPGLAFDVLDGVGLPFPAESFDAVLLFSVLTCICDDAGQRRIVEDIARVLRPNGIIYVSDILVQEDDRNRARYDAAQARLPGQPYGVFELEPGVMFRHLTRAWIDELFGRFGRIDLVELPVTTMNGNAVVGFQYFGRNAPVVASASYG
jgi:SAM-dependent methyltransferase